MFFACAYIPILHSPLFATTASENIEFIEENEA